MGNLPPQSGPEQPEIEAAIGRARAAVSSNLSQVARETNLDVKTVKTYEGERDDRQPADPRWVRPVRYLHYLVNANDRARKEVLALLGIEAPPEVLDSQVNEILGLLMEARPRPGWDNLYWGIKAIIKGAKREGEPNAATPGAPGA